MRAAVTQRGIIRASGLLFPSAFTEPDHLYGQQTCHSCSQRNSCVGVSAPAQLTLVPGGLNVPWQEFPDVTMHGAFELQARRTPHVNAVTDDGEHNNGRPVSLSYKKLDSRAGALAMLLRNSGLQPEERVAVAMHRCVAMVVAVLGTNRHENCG